MKKTEAGGPAHKPRSRLVRVSMATRLAASVVIVSFLALMVATTVGLTTGERLGKRIYESQLTSLGAAGAFDVAADVRSTIRIATSLAASPQAAFAIDQFDDALGELADESLTRTQTDELIEKYQEQFIDPLLAAGRKAEIRNVVATDAAATYLQYNYAVDLGVIDEPTFIDDAMDGSRWSEIHSVVHPIYRNVTDELDLLDIYLVSSTDSRVVYSAEKRPDLGTSLAVGPFSGSILSTTVNRVINNPGEGTMISDLAYYDAFPGVPVGVVASPVMDNGRLVGVVALMYDGSEFTDALTANGRWEAGGYPESADTYLIGDNATTRSDPREFIEDPQTFLDESQAAGILSLSQRTAIEAVGTTVLIQPVVDATFTAGEEDAREIATRSSLTGQNVLTLVTPVPLDGVTWYVVAEIDTSAAESQLDDFKNILIVSAAIFVVVIAFFAVGWGNNILRPVRAISERLGSRRGELGALEIAERSPIELKALASSFESMAVTLDRQQVDLALAREERLRVMRRMLPPAVAARIASGVLQSVDQVPKASVIVLVVLGMGDLVRANGENADLDLVDRMNAELDDLAEHHGVDRIKVVGDAYFGASGHDRPYIDHAPRVIAFAEDAADALRELSNGSPADLGVAVGIHTGPVMVGMTGGGRLLYDVWGETVTVAHHLARRAGRGQILVTEATRSMLPDNIEATAVSIPGSDDQTWSVVTSTVEATT